MAVWAQKVSKCTGWLLHDSAAAWELQLTAGAQHHEKHLPACLPLALEKTKVEIKCHFYWICITFVLSWSQKLLSSIIVCQGYCFVLANRIQQHIKELCTMTKKFYPKNVKFNIEKSINIIHYINKTKDKTHDYINRCGESICQNPTSFHDKNIQQTRSRRKYPQPDKGLYEKLTANIILNGKKLKVACVRSGTRQWMPMLTTSISIRLYGM